MILAASTATLAPGASPVDVPGAGAVAEPVTASAPRPLFFLGTHQPGWLTRAGVPLFVSDTRLRTYKTLPRAAASWACDSGGFSQIKQHGRWTITPQEYIARLRRYRDEIGHLLWAAPQDSMCEPDMIDKARRVEAERSGRTPVSRDEQIRLHLARTVANVVLLWELAPDLPIIPVLQGWTVEQYLCCLRLYVAAGIDLTTLPLVGVGSMCRRQSTAEARRIIAALRTAGLRRLHLFGFKTLGLRHCADLLTDQDSADSLAWSDDARWTGYPVCGQVHPRGAKNCANCLPYALQWRAQLLADVRRPKPVRVRSRVRRPASAQLHLWDQDGAQ